MKKQRTILSHALYFVGHMISEPMVHLDWAFLYPIHRWLMFASLDCDPERRVWKRTGEGEMREGQ
jgi:hypothetical protein